MTNDLIGYTVVVTTSGYGGEMNLIVGFDKDYAIKNVKLLNNSETPGVGKNAEKPHYMDKFIGTNTKSKPIPTKKSMLSQTDSDAVTGATITYNGITSGLIKANNLLKTETESQSKSSE
jgi:electron transport complex protein RnfG